MNDISDAFAVRCESNLCSMYQRRRGGGGEIFVFSANFWIFNMPKWCVNDQHTCRSFLVIVSSSAFSSRLDIIYSSYTTKYRLGWLLLITSSAFVMSSIFGNVRRLAGGVKPFLFHAVFVDTRARTLNSNVVWRAPAMNHGRATRAVFFLVNIRKLSISLPTCAYVSAGKSRTIPRRGKKCASPVPSEHLRDFGNNAMYGAEFFFPVSFGDGWTCTLPWRTNLEQEYNIFRYFQMCMF